MYLDQHITAVIPAFNEEPSIGIVVRNLLELQAAGTPLIDHVIVCDNASTDQTARRASDAGAAVVYEPRRGYGSACLAALGHLPETDIVLFVDADHSVDLSQTRDLLAALDNADLVIGSRRLGRAQAGAMTPQQIWGNRLVTFLMRQIWRQPVTDLGPFRLLRARTLAQLQMADTAYGWTVEMQAKALCLGLRVQEVPVHSLRRIGRSKISGTWRGTLGAMYGILTTLAGIAWRCKFNRRRGPQRQPPAAEIPATHVSNKTSPDPFLNC